MEGFFLVLFAIGVMIHAWLPIVRGVRAEELDDQDLAQLRAAMRHADELEEDMHLEEVRIIRMRRRMHEKLIQEERERQRAGRENVRYMQHYASKERRK